MPTCPLCEHVQENGEVCEVCGRQLVEVTAPTVNAAPMAGLEQTRWEEPFPEDADPIPDLELTMRPAAGAVPETPMADIEATSLPGIGGEVAPETLDGMDLGRAADDGERVPLNLGAVTCRYCKNVQAEGAFCERCGMRLDRMRAPPQAAAAAASGDALTRCRRCGEKVLLGARCGACGMAAPLEAEGA